MPIPTNTVLNSDPSKISNTSESDKGVEQRIEINDSQTTDNSSVPDGEEVHKESAPSVVSAPSKEKNEVDVNKDSISTLEPAPKTDSTEDQISTPSSDESAKVDTKIDKFNNESSEDQQPPAAEVIQTDTKGLEKESQVVPDVSMTLENTSLEANESEIVTVIKESENISESSTTIDQNLSDNVTQEIREEKEDINIQAESISKGILVNEISNTSESTPSDVETQDSTVSSPSDVKNTEKEILPAENDVSNITAETEVPNDPSKNILQNTDKTEKDHIVSPLVDVPVIPESNVESNLPSSNDTSQNSSATVEASNNLASDVEKVSDDAKPDLAPSILPETEISNETSPESNYEDAHFVPTMPSFPDNKEPLVASETPQTFSEEVINATQLDNQATSEEINPIVNATHDLDPNKTENEHMTKANQQHDSVTPEAIPYEGYPPHHIGSTTELPEETKLPMYTEENSDSNESVPVESPAPSSSVGEDIPLSKLPEPYSYIKSSPYPGMLPKIETENQPSFNENSESVSSQEIIETEPEAGSDYIDQSNESVSSEAATATFDEEQKPGLNDFIHSTRVKVDEDQPEPISESETLEEKSVYETMGEYLPDFSILSEKLTSLFDFGSSSPKEFIESEVCSAGRYFYLSYKSLKNW